MGYDGGLKIAIKNKELGKVLKKHFDAKLFEERPYISDCVKGKKYKRKTMDFYYENMDCADIQVCPRSVSQVYFNMTSFFDALCNWPIDDPDCSLTMEAYNDFKRELAENKDAIENGFEFILWEYYRPDGCGGGSEIFKFDGENESFKEEEEDGYW